MSKDMGGPAFPYIEPPGPRGVVSIQRTGMKLWDHYAAAALQGLVSRDGYEDPDDAARDAGGYADAMLEERRKRKGES